jgi:hypothetical protein
MNLKDLTTTMTRTRTRMSPGINHGAEKGTRNLRFGASDDAGFSMHLASVVGFGG